MGKQFFRGGIILLLSYITVLPSVGNATVNKPDGTDPIESDTKLVRVTITTSRQDVTGDAEYGMSADLQNIGSAPLTIAAKDVVLVLQPELFGDQNCVPKLEGMFPTEVDKTPSQIVLQPKEHYAVIWDVAKVSVGTCTKPGPPTNWWGRFTTSVLDKLSFVPGDYVVIVEGKIFLTPASGPDANYHTFAETVKIHVGLSQLDTMMAAMLGGIIAYLVMALRSNGDIDKFRKQPASDVPTKLKRFGVISRNVFSAALVSAVVTVVLSRISDTQFPIKISVGDFWGALTIGFVAYFAGNSLIDRLVGLVTKPPKPNGTVT